MFDRPRSGEKAVLVHLRFGPDAEAASQAEFVELIRSAGAQPVAMITGARQTPDPAYFAGRGKVEEIRVAVEAEGAEVVVFNHELSPAQERNLERALECRVLDRTGVILDIFAQRARSFEGKLQVELAQLQHLSTRLVRGWTHLERQKGGIGLRGPGETQLETDRRLLGERIKQIHKRLEKVRKQREQGRRGRKRAELPIVSLVGYTNAGKSTLFNRLTEASVYVADQLFATLDPSLRRLQLPDKIPLILVDTVGFIQQLPHDLVEAFRSTLDETAQADLLLHVVDASDPEHLQRIQQVNQVLSEIGAQEVPQLLVYNKIDRVEADAPRLELAADGKAHRVWLSAATGEGVALLLQGLSQHLSRQRGHYRLQLPVNAGQTRARLHQVAQVLTERFEDNGDCLLEIEMQVHDFERLRQQFPELRVVSETLLA